MDKTLILNKIKFHYSFKNDVEFANFLGVSPQTISSWYQRNTFNLELIYAKCVEINANWLLTGEGEMFLNFSEKSTNSFEKCIDKMTNYIEMLEKENKKLNKELEEMKQNKPFTVAPGAGGSSLKKEIC